MLLSLLLLLLLLLHGMRCICEIPAAVVDRKLMLDCWALSAILHLLLMIRNW